jgi:hypothetical protein
LQHGLCWIFSNLVGQSSPVKVFLSYGPDQNAPLVAGTALLDLDHWSHDLARAIDEKLRAGVQHVVLQVRDGGWLLSPNDITRPVNM